MTQGGLIAGGVRQVLLPLVIKTVKEVINEEMDIVVDDLKEESVDITEQSVLGMVTELTQKRALTVVEKIAKNKIDGLVNQVKTTSFHTTYDNINRMF